MTEQNTIEEKQEEQEQLNSSEIVEVDWEKVEHIWNIRESLAVAEEEFKRASLDYEKLKFGMLAKIAEAQNVLYQKAEMLREESGISKEIVYELKLPQNQGEKAYFLRKEP